MYMESLNNGKVVVECCNARLSWSECDLSARAASLDAVTALSQVNPKSKLLRTHSCLNVGILCESLAKSSSSETV